MPELSNLLSDAVYLGQYDKLKDSISPLLQAGVSPLTVVGGMIGWPRKRRKDDEIRAALVDRYQYYDHESSRYCSFADKPCIELYAPVPALVEAVYRESLDAVKGFFENVDSLGLDDFHEYLMDCVTVATEKKPELFEVYDKTNKRPSSLTLDYALLFSKNKTLSLAQYAQEIKKPKIQDFLVVKLAQIKNEIKKRDERNKLLANFICGEVSARNELICNEKDVREKIILSDTRVGLLYCQVEESLYRTQLQGEVLKAYQEWFGKISLIYHCFEIKISEMRNFAQHKAFIDSLNQEISKHTQLLGDFEKEIKEKDKKNSTAPIDKPKVEVLKEGVNFLSQRINAFNALREFYKNNNPVLFATEKPPQDLLLPIILAIQFLHCLGKNSEYKALRGPRVTDRISGTEKYVKELLSFIPSEIREGVQGDSLNYDSELIDFLILAPIYSDVGAAVAASAPLDNKALTEAGLAAAAMQSEKQAVNDNKSPSVRTTPNYGSGAAAAPRTLTGGLFHEVSEKKVPEPQKPTQKNLSVMMSAAKLEKEKIMAELYRLFEPKKSEFDCDQQQQQQSTETHDKATGGSSSAPSAADKKCVVQ